MSKFDDYLVPDGWSRQTDARRLSGSLPPWITCAAFERGPVRVEIVPGTELFGDGSSVYLNAADGAVTIQVIAVDKIHRGEGHARRALRSVLMALKAIGFKKVWIESCVVGGVRHMPKGLDKAKLDAWYERAGFKAAGHDPKRPTQVMVLELADYIGEEA